MTEYFASVRGAPSLYVDNEDGALTDVGASYSAMEKTRT